MPQYHSSAKTNAKHHVQQAGRSKADQALIQEIFDHPDVAMETFIRIEDRDEQSSIIPLKLNAGQRKLHELIEGIRKFNIKRSTAAHAEDPTIKISDNPVRIVMLKSRRIGGSVYVTARGELKCVRTPAFKLAVMAHKGKNAQEIFRYIRNYHDRWPKEFADLLPGGEPSQNGAEFDNGSVILTMTAGGKEQGRGIQADFYHFSECAHYETYAEVRTALYAAPWHAWVFEESTANGPAGGFYDRWQSAKTLEEVEDAYEKGDFKTLNQWESGGGYFRFFFSWLEDPGYKLHVPEREIEYTKYSLTPYERHLTKIHGATLGQIKWRRLKMSVRGNETDDERGAGLSDEQFFQQEFPATPEEAFQSTGNLTFETNILNQMELDASRLTPPMMLRIEATRPPIKTRLAYEANTTIWEPPQEKAFYVIGVDAGWGTKTGDYSVAAVFDRTDGTTLKEVCTFAARVGTVEFGDIVTMLAEWYNKAFVAPEAMGPGQSTCIRLVKDNRYMYVYQRETLDLVKDTDGDAFRIGFWTSSQTKGTLIQMLKQAILDGTIEFRTKRTIDEHKVYKQEKQPSGIWTFGAPKGKHDDHVMASALALMGHQSGLAPPITARRVHARFVAPKEPLPPDDRRAHADFAKKDKGRRKKEAAQKAKRARSRLRTEARVTPG